MRFVLGIDPGKSGGFALINLRTGKLKVAHAFSHFTEKDVSDIIGGHASDIDIVYMEKVHSMPRDGVRSAHSFGENKGLYRGLLLAHELPFELVTPQKWQKSLGCLTGGDKNITKSYAQQLFPKAKVTHAVADAILIAVYGFRVESQRLGKIKEIEYNVFE